MSSFYLKLEEFLNNGKNFNKIIFILVVFLFVIKLPSLVITDIQPWDEGMYATRVLSIHSNGDFFDQSFHSVGRFYSGSHPPLLIWIGYFATLIFGVNSIALKIIPLIFSLLCIVLISLIGKRFFDIKIGLFAALIFSSNIIFNVFSIRFQFDIPYTFFILLSFYTMFLFNETLSFKYLIISGISFGCCLMIKILVGFYIPIILLISYYFIKKKINFKFKDVVILTVIGVTLALPWHLYMLFRHGNEFIDYFFKFHIYDRALYGVEMNVKSSGVFYYINYLLSILPYSILIFFSFIKDFLKRKSLNWKKIFLWVWFITGLIILILFETKLEVYILLILTPGCFLISLFINELDKENLIFKTSIILFTFFNIFWFATESIRGEIKSFVASQNMLVLIFSILVTISLFFLLSKYLVNKFELKKTYYIFILIFFLVLNLYYAVRIPEWENKFQLSEAKSYIENRGKKKIMYVGTNYRYNPQFSFYFKGLNLDWENSMYEFELIDTKEGIDKTKERLKNLKPNDYLIVVEKDYINRAEYQNSDLFMPDDYKLILKRRGYELYEN